MGEKIENASTPPPQAGTAGEAPLSQDVDPIEQILARKRVKMGEKARTVSAAAAQRMEKEAAASTRQTEPAPEAPNAVAVDAAALLADSAPERAETSESAAPSAPPATVAPQAPASHAIGFASLQGATRRAAVYLIVGFASALAMGAILSYRQNLAQREIVGQLAHSFDRIDRRLTQMEKPESVLPKPSQAQAPSFDDYTRMLNTAHAHFAQGRFLDAAVSYTEALKTFPTGSLADQAHYRLAICLAKTGRKEAAADHLRAVVTGFPGSRFYARSALELSHLLMEQQQYAQARRILYGVLGARDRLEVEERECLEKAYYALARCFEGEADAAARANQAVAQAGAAVGGASPTPMTSKGGNP